MAAVGNNFNRVIQSSVSAADIAAGTAWVALNLELTAGQKALIASFDLFVSVVGADYNNLQFVQVIFIKNVNMNPGISANSQLGAGTEQVYNTATAFLSERVLHREWNAPYPLEGPGRYALYGQAFFGAFVGPTTYTMCINGQVISTSGQKEFPFELR